MNIIHVNKRVFRADALLLLTAAVWGFGFVAQRSGMQYIGPFAFNGIRFFLASLSLLPLIAWRSRSKGQAETAAKPDQGSRKAARRRSFVSSFFAGTCLFVAVTFQQLGIMATTAGNAGFITGLYVIFTPIFGIFLGKKTGKATWVGAVLTLTGLYFLSFSGSLGGLNPGDIIIAIGALFWTCHVLIIDWLVQKNDPIVLSSGQFAFAGLYAIVAAFLVEPLLSAWLEGRQLAGGFFFWKSFPALISGLGSGTVPSSLILDALIPILYGGLISAGVGYTLQVVAQQDAPPAHATIILCLEGSFAVFGGVLLLHEPMGVRKVIGFILMLAGMLVSQSELIRSRPPK
jgi:drug/metabolite transporter (DMT)-like permease